MRQRDFLALISRKRSGPFATLLRALLRVLSCFYRAAVLLRLGAYRLRLLKGERVSVPVICVGNLTTGGTGKTPAVAMVVKQLQELGRRPAIVSRGYKAGDDAANDEMKVLAELCPGVTHIQNPYRAEGARQAIAEGADVIVLDDGFSHLALRRDLDVLLLDSLNPFGYGRMLPRGLLREPIRGVRRAGFAIFTRADVATPERLQDLEDTIRCKGFTGAIAHAAHAPARLLRLADGEPLGLETLQSAAIAPFCGIGHPLGFRRTLEALGARLTPLEMLELDDHQEFNEAALRRELEPFLRACAEAGASLAVCTQKDAVKLRGRIGNDWPLPIHELQVEFRLLTEEDEFTNTLRRSIGA